MRFRRMPAALLAVLLLSGCGAGEAADAEGAALRVCASFDAMADFVGRIGGERVALTTMTASGAEPHDWEPTPRDIARLEDTDILFLSGGGFESWAADVEASLTGDTVVADTSVNIELTGDHDPHVWLDPMNAERQMTAIAAVLTEHDPDGAEVYQANLLAASAELTALDEEFRLSLHPLPRKEIVVAHEAYGYLCAAYGLTQTAVQGLAPEGEPDPARMAEIVEYVKAHGVTTIFFEGTASPKVAEAIARETGAATAALSPLETIPEGEDYFSVMRTNLAALEAALS